VLRAALKVLRPQKANELNALSQDAMASLTDFPEIGDWLNQRWGREPLRTKKIW
jgi:hypothetical protein